MSSELVVHESPKAPISEAIRLLRTNLSFMNGKRKNQVILLTSAAPGDGKSWVSANLAAAYAQSDKKVLLVDADLRKGRQHKIFGRFNTRGFLFFLQGDLGIEDDIEIQADILMKSITTTEVKNLFLVPSGIVPPNPAELLDTEGLNTFLQIVKQNFDVIIFDAPPVSIVADSLVLCKKVDNVVLVTAAEVTKKDMIIEAKKTIQQVGGKISGVVVNKMPSEKRKEYTKYYAHYSDELTTLNNKRNSR